MKYLLATIAALLLTSPAYADRVPNRVKSISGCTLYLMCDAQTATGPCTTSPASGEKIVLNAAGRSKTTFYGLQSIGAHSCDVFTNDKGYDLSAGAGQKINNMSIDESFPVLTLEGPLFAVWVECTSITTSATITALSCTGTD